MSLSHQFAGMCVGGIEDEPRGWVPGWGRHQKSCCWARHPGHEPDGMEERSGVQDSGKRRIIEMEPMDEQGVVLQHQSQNRDPLSYGLKVSFIFEHPEASY